MAKGFYVGINNVARKIKEGFVGVASLLPEGYTQVEYIESSGEQYIDIGITGALPVSASLKMRTGSGTSSADDILIGATGGGATTVLVYWFESKWYVFTGTSNTSSGTGYLADNTDYVIESNLSSTARQFSISGSTIINQTVSGSGTSNNLYLFAYNNNGSVSHQCTCRLYYCKLYQSGVLVRDFVPCINPDNEIGLYDMANGKFYANNGTGAFVAGDSKSNSPVARRIKEAFIGIGGVARPCWGAGELKYYGAITSLNAARYNLAATTVGDYALFGGGGISSSTRFATVDTYTKSLTHSTTTDLSVARYQLAAGTIGDYALFVGGYSTAYANTTDAYDKSLTRTTPTGWSGLDLSSATVGNYVLFGGGDNSLSYLPYVRAYDTSLTLLEATDLSVARSCTAATTTSNYALFGGGYYDKGSVSHYSTVDAYDKSLTRTTTTELSVARYQLAATSVGNYALFGGGKNTTITGMYDTVDAYDTSLTRTTPAALSAAKYALASTSVGDYALFGGGYSSATGDDVYYSTMDVYDISLTRTTATDMSQAREFLDATTIGNYALFGGGYDGSNSSVVDAYVVA